MLADCLRSLEQQTMADFEIVVVDNSGRRSASAGGAGARVIANDSNVGFGAAVNQGIRASEAPFVATLNDDAVAHPQWLESLLGAIEPRMDVGMCASQVRLYGEDRLDSAGMLIAADGSSKQRGHGESPSGYSRLREVLLPSASAALYRRAMLDEIGCFDESFFLYCEDTDLGLRARWAGWECLYVPAAVVEHRYSHSAGRASPLKAYYVERNRLFTVLKSFPARRLLAAPWFSLARYFWHLVSLRNGRGKAAEFRAAGHSASHLPMYVFRAHLAALRSLPRLLRERKRIRRRLTPRQFGRMLRTYSIGVRQVADL